MGDDCPFDPSPWVGFRRVILWGSNHFAERLPVGTTLVWVKRKDHLYGSFLSDAEVAWQKGGYGVYCHKYTRQHNQNNRRVHPNEKPIPLMGLVYRTPQAQTRLDDPGPVHGLGIGRHRGHPVGHHFIGIEIDPEFFRIARARIAAPPRSTLPPEYPTRPLFQEFS